MKDLETELQHFEQLELNPRNRPLTFPIYQSAKFEHDTFEGFLNSTPGDFHYSRVSNPTVRQLELMLAKIQGRDDAMAFASGVSAIAFPLLALLQSGDHLIFFAEGYAPTRYIIRDLLGKFGVTHTMLFYDQLDELSKHVKKNTKIIYFESPTNPSLIVPDIQKIVSVAKEANVLTMLDNTLAGFHQHGEFEIDIFAHSLTKYASGHGDVIGGAVIASKHIIQLVKATAITLGSTLDPHTAFLVLRGMKTYLLRYQKQCENALEVAKYLSHHPRIKKVRYPGLENDRCHQLAKKQMKDFGSIVTIDLQDDVDQNQFMNRLKYFSVAGSLGSTESLALPVKRLFGHDLTSEEQTRAALLDSTIRLSIGLESAKDLCQDLELALL